QRDQDLVDVTIPKAFREHHRGLFNNFLNRKLAIATVKVRNDIHHFALPIGDPRPPAGKKIGIKLSGNLIDGDGGFNAGAEPLDPNVKNLSADELNEIRIAAR